ncbi:MAG: hypothetical protein NTZ85_05085 [Bacteroidia bacterium]|jgi:hypothetical protein|nr:hypothetical protein [Bacteroidia bacterium]
MIRRNQKKMYVCVAGFFIKPDEARTHLGIIKTFATIIYLYDLSFPEMVFSEI